MKRLKKILKWSGIVLGGLVALALVANGVFVWITGARLERQLAAIRAAGDPLSIADLAPRPIAPEENANTYIRRADADTEAIWEGISKSNVRSVCISWPPRPLMTRADQKTIQAVFAAHPKAIPLLKRAALCPAYDARFDYTASAKDFVMQLLQAANKFRSVALVLNSHALLLANEGNGDEAMRTILLMLRLARQFSGNPTTITLFMATAIREMATNPANLALQTGSVSEPVRSALDAELAVQERMDGYSWALKSERALVRESLRSKPQRNFWLVARGRLNQEESRSLNMLQVLLAHNSSATTCGEVRQAIDATPESLMVPRDAARSINEIVMRSRAEIRALRVLNALQRYDPGRSEEVPQLAELGLPAETISDPFTGEPLLVKKTPRGWLVYSVGPNLKDDGGKLDDPLNGDVGIAPPPMAEKPAKNEREAKEK